MTGPRQYLRASDVGEFAFCGRAWHLASRGVRPRRLAADREAGVRHHARHGASVARARRIWSVARAATWLALALVLAAAALSAAR